MRNDDITISLYEDELLTIFGTDRYDHIGEDFARILPKAKKVVVLASGDKGNYVDGFAIQRETHAEKIVVHFGSASGAVNTFYPSVVNDIVYGGKFSIGDHVSYLWSPEGVQISLGGANSIGWGRGGYADGDQLFDIGTLTGTFYADTLAAGNSNNAVTINAGWGNDKVYGSDYGDFLKGGLGNDYVAGGKGFDMLFGGVGDDVINGGEGGDYLFGGSGADTFLYSSFTQNHGLDRIHDFEDGIDKFNFSGHASGISDLRIEVSSDNSNDAVITCPGVATVVVQNAAGLIDNSDFIW